MNYCININNPLYRVEIAKLTKILGDSNAAIAALELNNGYSLDKAPNGKQSILFETITEIVARKNPQLSKEEINDKTTKLKLLVYSDNFKEWFGDWINDPNNASKVVDENGEPLIVYHYSDNEKLLEFKKDFNNYFSAIKGGTKHAIFTTTNNEPILDRKFQIPLFVNIKTPFQYSGTKEQMHKEGTSYTELVNKAEQYGGAIFTNLDDNRLENQTVIVIYDPNNLKSVYNNGQYSTALNNIYEEHQIVLNGNKDQWLVSLLGSAAKKEIPLKEFVESLYNRTAFKGLYDLLHQKHLTSRKHSVIEGTKIILESSLNWFSNYNKQRDLKKRFNEKRAFYDASTNELHINVDSEFTNGNADSVIWHELLHAMTVDRLQNQTNRKKFEQILKDYLKSNEYNRDVYTGENGLEEFVADVWSDPDLITLLQQTKSPRKGFGYVWDQIKSWLMEAFGVSPDNSLFAEASEEIDKILNQRTFDLSNQKFYEHLNDFDQDTKDLVALMQYQYSKEGLTQDEINQRIKAFLNNDKQEVNTVKKFVDFVQIRQAQLHTLGKDFGAESYTANGFFDWGNYLKGIDLRHDITEEDDLSAFEPITDYVIEPAEIIVPKIYKSQFKLGNYDIADIDENFFKKVNPFYDCSLKPSKSPDLSQVKIDVLVRTHISNYNVIIKDDLSAPIEGLTRVEPRIEDGWRLSLSGKRMYQIPLDLTFEIYKDKNGVETLVIKNGEGVEKSVRKLISSTENLVSVQLFLENVKPTEDWINFAITNNNINSNNQILKQIKRRIVNNEANDDAIRGDLSMLYYDHRNKVKYKNDLASILYNSFVKSLYLVSVRIPTQAFQSIMATKAAGLTNDDSNNVFVTRWQFWLQGSKQ